MENLKAMIEQMKVKVNETVNAINSKQCEVAKLMYDIKNLSNASIAKAKVYEEMATAMMNMADDLRTQAEDVKDWAMYDLSLEEDDDEEDEDDEMDEEICDFCGEKAVEPMYDDYGWCFCSQECLERHAQENEQEEKDITEEELSLFD